VLRKTDLKTDRLKDMQFPALFKSRWAEQVRWSD